MESMVSSLSEQQDAIFNGNDSGVDLEGALSANLYFTICDEISNDPQDFVSINTCNTTKQVKQGPKSDIINTSNQPTLQYRIVSQRSQVTLPRSSSVSSTTPTVTLRAVSLDNTNSNAKSSIVQTPTLLPTTMQLPSGCEIYLVKEYVEPGCGDLIVSGDCEESSINRFNPSQNITFSNCATQTVSKLASVSLLQKTVIKSEPGTEVKNENNSKCTSKIDKRTFKTNGTVVSNYKKRDDKRRATHNEIERRRRDKINSWIFKLKTMLPAETAKTINLSNNSTKGFSTVVTSTSNIQFDFIDQQQQQNQSQLRTNTISRSSQNDSKSQILVKACEYIKAMQVELNSLRECLMENEKLKTSNHLLQNELNKLKNSERPHQHQVQKCENDDFTMTICTKGNGNFEVVNNSALFTTESSISPTSVGLIGGPKTAIGVPLQKRELIISDYVD